MGCGFVWTRCAVLRCAVQRLTIVPVLLRPAATKTTTMRYGGQLQHSAKFDDTIDYGNTIGYDKSAAPASWKSVTQSVHAPPAVAKPTEFSTSFKLGTNEFTDAAKADEYRSKW